MVTDRPPAGPGLLAQAMRMIGTINWLRLGIRRRLVNFVYPLDRVPAWEFETAFQGLIYRGRLDVAQDWHVFFFGGYELKELSLLKDIIKSLSEANVWDVGANLGGHTLTMASHASQVFSFEPYHPLADKIRAQLELNSIDNVTVHDFGLGEYNEQAGYYLDTAAANSGTGSFVAEHNDSAKVETLMVRRGDDCADGLKIDLLKIDVEGFEGKVLAGLQATLQSCEPILLIEMTETAEREMAALGGLKRLIPFAHECYEVCNPHYFMGFFQFRMYALRLVSKPVARAASYNFLIVPVTRTKELEKVIEPAILSWF